MSNENDYDEQPFCVPSAFSFSLCILIDDNHLKKSFGSEITEGHVEHGCHAWAVGHYHHSFVTLSYSIFSVSIRHPFKLLAAGACHLLDRHHIRPRENSVRNPDDLPLRPKGVG